MSLSLDVRLTLTGDLDNPRNRDLAEHLLKLVRTAVEKAAADTPGSTATVGDPWEEKKVVFARGFDGFVPFGSPSHTERSVGSFYYVHLPPPDAVASAPVVGYS